MSVEVVRTLPRSLPWRRVAWGRCVLAALPAWLLARAIVLAAFLFAGWRHGERSLRVWDTDWYLNLAATGYGPYGAEGSRFFPLLPAIIRLGGSIGLPAHGWLLAVNWVAALFLAAGLYRLTVLETGDEAAARRAAWLIQIVPGAGVLALGYTEALAGLLAVLYFLVLRTPGSARVGVLAGVLSGLVRPTGPLLAVPGAVQAVRSRPERAGPARVRAWLVALAPLAGTAAYLAWAWRAYGDPFTPYRVHTATDLRGGVASAPWQFLLRNSPGGYPWWLGLSLLAVAAVGLYLCWRRLPAPYALWALPMVGLAATAWGLHSLPRYLAAVFPLWMALAVAWRWRAFWALLAVSATGFAYVAYLHFVPGGPVP